MPDHDTYVWCSSNRRWWWKCSCAPNSIFGPWVRRGDADTAADDHIEEERREAANAT